MPAAVRVRKLGLMVGFYLIFAFAASVYACRRRVFLLLRQKKVTKEKATPGSLESPKKNSLAKAP
ncbi:MAG TPA: hypothetical protein DCS87_08925, partial [Rheinheimera sp.]|nr:hypothetical protein [Rheinheimera sp.]